MAEKSTSSPSTKKHTAKKKTRARARSTKSARVQNEGRVGGTLRTGFRATSTLIGGTANAVAEAVGDFSDCMTMEKLNRCALNNGLIVGTVRGYARFFAEMAATAEKVAEDIADAPDLCRRDSE